MKVICMYLPQYHETEENDKWWGKGYTEWTAVKRNKPVYKGHAQPRVPLDGYYDLVEDFQSTLEKQAKLMKDYNVYGLCFYHYWFSGKKLLNKPLEMLLEHPEIDLHYSLCWANESWTRTWDGNAKEILIEQKYDDAEDWTAHFDYLDQFFSDPRYIKIDGMPVIHIYKSREIPCLQEMMRCWRQLAKQRGYKGIYVVVGNTMGRIETREDTFDAYYNFEPGYSLHYKRNKLRQWLYGAGCVVKMRVNKIFGTKILEHRIDCRELYRKTTKNSKLIVQGKKTYYGTFPMWDNTPRRSYKGTVITHCSPQLFRENLLEIKALSKEDDFVYINAWNEWSEGAYLEGDNFTGYQYLEAIKEVCS